MKIESREVLSGEILDETAELTLRELCGACGLPAERVFELVDEGVIEPSGAGPGQWRFSAVCVRRVRCVARLTGDLGVNLAGAALAMELIDELEALRVRLQRFEREWP